MNTNIMEEYHNWLCDLIVVDQKNKSYWKLTDALHHKEFRWSVPNDDNRAFEGRNLREKFCDEIGMEYEYLDFEEAVSILEVVIALAYRCESIMEDNPSDRPMSDWFWKIITNSGLHRFTDEAWEYSNVDAIVDMILNKIIDRTYQSNGVGGLFPLKRDRKDQRKVELWYQMNAYLVENYYSDGAVL